MTEIPDDLVEFLESQEKAVRDREAAEDAEKNEREREHGLTRSDDRYRSEREENDRRRARRSGDGDAHGPNRSSHSRPMSRRNSYSPQPMMAQSNYSPQPMEISSHSPQPMADVPPRRAERQERSDRPAGDFYSGGGRPARDEYRPGSSGSDRSRGRRSIDRRRGPSRSRSPQRSYKGRDGRGPGRYRSRSPPRGHGQGRRRGAPPPEPTDDERDRRTVFVQQLANRVRTKELSKFFEQAGEVVEAQIVKDRVSNRSKGVGYVEFKDEASVEKAIALTGQKLCGIPIIAQLTEAEKNRQARNTEGNATQSNGVPFHRLYVGNIHFSINEEDLKHVFEPFGELEFVQLQKEEHTGRSKGYGFVQYHDPAQAKEALDKMNGFELAGRAIRVGLGNDKFTNESTQHILRSQAPQFTGSSFSGAGGRGAHAGGTANFDRASGRDAEKAGGASALDDTDVGGVNFSNYSRDSLMRKLARTEDPEPKVQPKATQQKKVPVAQTPASRCVLLKNMFDQAKETGTDWQAELKDDIKTECEEKYGKVMHIGIALDNNDGEIYIKFDRIQGGENAIRGLNGRYFDGQMISADYVIEAMYNANFPKAKNL